jgi:hypothetical protein
VDVPYGFTTPISPATLAIVPRVINIMVAREAIPLDRRFRALAWVEEETNLCSIPAMGAMTVLLGAGEVSMNDPMLGVAGEAVLCSGGGSSVVVLCHSRTGMVAIRAGTQMEGLLPF